MPADARPLDPIVRNVEDIARLEREARAHATRGERIARAVTDVVGSAACAYCHLVVLGVWIAWNVGWIPGLRPFDPYPFGLLTMVVSYEAAVVAIFVLVTQNRMAAEAERRERLTLEVEMLAEQEMTMVLRLLDRICQRLGVAAETRQEAEAQKLMEQTNVYEVMQKLDQKFGKP